MPDTFRPPNRDDPIAAQDWIRHSSHDDDASHATHRTVAYAVHTC